MVLLLGRGSEGTRERAAGQTAIGIESKRRQGNSGESERRFPCRIIEDWRAKDKKETRDGGFELRSGLCLDL